MVSNVATIWPVEPLVAGLGLLGLLLLLAQRGRLQGTTLMAAWWWAMVAWLSIVSVELWARSFFGEPLPRWIGHLRFVAACASFCPIMAQLGAKRPQDRAWQFIVLSLWIVVALPAGEALLYSPDSPLDLHAARRWFLVLLIGLGLVNTLPTRYGLSGLLYACGQGSLLAAQMPWADGQTWGAGLVVGLGCGVAALALWVAELPRGQTPKIFLDRWWLDFRDAYGLLWSLRVAERFNAAAQMYQWPLRLKWGGFEWKTEAAEYEQLDSRQRQVIERVLRTLAPVCLGRVDCSATRQT